MIGLGDRVQHGGAFTHMQARDVTRPETTVCQQCRYGTMGSFYYHEREASLGIELALWMKGQEWWGPSFCPHSPILCLHTVHIAGTATLKNKLKKMVLQQCQLSAQTQ